MIDCESSGSKKRKKREISKKLVPVVRIIPKKYLVMARSLVGESSSEQRVMDRLNVYGKERRNKVRHFCSYDLVREANQKNYNDIYPTDTQALLLQMRRSVSEHDWPTLARCVDFALNLNGKLMPAVWKACVTVLLNHEQSNEKRISQFLHLCLGAITPEEKNKFVVDLMTLPKSLDHLSPPLRVQQT